MFAGSMLKELQQYKAAMVTFRGNQEAYRESSRVLSRNTYFQLRLSIQ